MRPLLAVDGDSFAHRAFHALPRSFRRDDGGPANTLIGFMSMLLRLWQAERPRAVVVGWDTLGVPTYRNELLATYQSGREFDPEIVDQLALLPGPRLLDGDRLRQGRAATRPTTSSRLPSRPSGPAAARRSSRPPTATRSSSRHPTSRSCSRCAASASCSGSARRRCASATASSRSRCRDFIALRGDPSDKIPGARGVGEKTAASLLQTFPDLEAMIAAGRFEAEAEQLRIVPPDRDARSDRAAPRSPGPRAGLGCRRASGRGARRGAPRRAHCGRL